MQAIPQHLVHQGMIRHFTFALDVFKTGELVRKNQRHQVFGIIALKGGGYTLAATHARVGQLEQTVDGVDAGENALRFRAIGGERDIGYPAPAGGKHRRIQQGLDQHLFYRLCG